MVAQVFSTQETEAAQRQVDLYRFETCLIYIERPCLIKKERKKEKYYKG